jgi:hypothetical protein
MTVLTKFSKLALLLLAMLTAPKLRAQGPPYQTDDLDLSPFLRQPVKRQYPANGGMEHGIVSAKVHA